METAAPSPLGMGPEARPRPYLRPHRCALLLYHWGPRLPSVSLGGWRRPVQGGGPYCSQRPSVRGPPGLEGHPRLEESQRAQLRVLLPSLQLAEHPASLRPTCHGLDHDHVRALHALPLALPPPQPHRRPLPPLSTTCPPSHTAGSSCTTEVAAAEPRTAPWGSTALPSG